MHHGGAARQVRAAAKVRLAALVDPAIARLAALLKSRHDPTALGACRDVLDRAGFKATDKHEVTGPDGTPLIPTINVVFVSASNGRVADTEPQGSELDRRQIAPPDEPVN